MLYKKKKGGSNKKVRSVGFVSKEPHRTVFLCSRDRMCSCTVLLPIMPKNWIKWMPKTTYIGNRERDRAWGCTRGINTTCETLQIPKHKWLIRCSTHRTELCFVICGCFYLGGVYPWAQPHAQSFSLFPIVLGVNKSAWRFDFQSMKLAVVLIEATLSVVFNCSS